MGLRQDILNQPVSRLGLRELLEGTVDMRIDNAVALMRKKHLGCVVILDNQKRPEGLFTERSLLRCLLDTPDCMNQPVADYVTRPAPCIGMNESIAALIKKMQSHQLRFVCVVNADGRGVGICGYRSAIEYLADHFPRSVKVQEMNAKLSMNQREGA